MTIQANYPKPTNYIKRHVKSIQSLYEYDWTRTSLSDVLNEEKRVVILGVAGLGKSIELENLAYEFSKSNSELQPVLISLNNITNESIEDLIKIEFKDFDNHPKDKLLILLDALDEVHTNFIDVVASKINQFVKTYSDLAVIVSCRNNFYNTEIERGKAKLELFKTYVLSPIDSFSINAYIHENVSENVEKLNDELHYRRLYDLLSSPFYLVKIIHFYNENLTLPKSKKDVFEYLIQKRIENDLDKYQNTGLNIEEYTSRINDVLEKIAIIMQHMGQNHLETGRVFGSIITDEKLSKIIKHTFLFNKTNKDQSWQFEHNNFKEYLAARYLSNLSVKQIKRITTLGGSLKIVKPNWLNTLFLLFSILPKGTKLDKLSRWILKNEADALVRLEKDKLPLEIREELFYRFHNDYSSRGILIRSEKFEPEDLAIMVSDSDAVLAFLIDKIDSSNEIQVLMNTLELFRYFDKVDQYTERISEVLFNRISKKESSNYLKYKCLEVYSELKVYSENLTQRILAVISLKEEEQYVRTGFYNYLESAPIINLENYINLLLEGVFLLREHRLLRSGSDRADSDPYLSSERYVLESLFRKLESLESIVKILEWAEQQEPEYEDEPFFQIVSDTINRCERFTNEEKKQITPLMVDVMFRFCKRYYENLDADFQKFFRSFDDPSIHLNLILSKSLDDEGRSNNYDHACAIVCDEKSVYYIVDEIKKGNLSDNQIIGLRNALSYRRKYGAFQEYYDAIISIDSKYEYEPHRDYNELKEERFQRDRKLLFAREEFISEINSFFERESTTEIHSSVLYDIRRNRFIDDDNIADGMSLEILRRFANDSERNVVEQALIVNRIEDDVWWKWFKFNKLKEWDSSKSEFDFTPEERIFMESWLKESLPKCDFKTAFSQNEKSYSFRDPDYNAFYLITRLDYKLDESAYLELLSVDSPIVAISKKGKDIAQLGDETGLTEWLVSKTSEDAIKRKVLANIKDKVVVDSVRENHYKFCAKYAINTITGYILEDIQRDCFEYYEKIRLIDYFIECKGNLDDLILLMDEMDYHVNLHILDKLFEAKHSGAIEVCKSFINAEQDVNIRLDYINKLITLDQNEGFEYHKNWILSNKSFPDRWYRYDNLSPVKLSDLLFLFQESLIKGFGKTNWTGHGRNGALDPIIKFGSEDNGSYKLVKKYIKSWIEFAPEERHLHYQLQKLDQLYYSKQTSVLDFESAYNEATNPFRLSIYKLDYFKDRAKIEILGIKVGVWGIVFGIIGIILGVISIVLVFFPPTTTN